jgi:DNA-binding NtrC family response regulator
MGRRIVALLENSIGPRLLLATHLTELGYAVTVLSAADAVVQQMQAEGLEWLILDEAALQPGGAALLDQLARTRARPRIAWLGPHPPASQVPIAVRFDKPLDYGEITRFISASAAGKGRR